MSIENQIARITNEVSTQLNLIDEIKSDLENKVGMNIKLQEKTVTPGTDEQVITPDEGYNGLSKVTVEGVSNVKHITQIIANPSNARRPDFLEPGNWQLTVCVNGEQKAECIINGLSDQIFETDFSFDISQDYLTVYISQNATTSGLTPITYCGFCVDGNIIYVKGY